MKSLYLYSKAYGLHPSGARERHRSPRRSPVRAPNTVVAAVVGAFEREHFQQSCVRVYARLDQPNSLLLIRNPNI
ncbi:hypothetical protein BpHYR1_020143 [Brachionus plicatilis]|uniref:Uncharacterized protein n=1 Tax=Brachionus plicatilis TaxID=10195 RepID=A0A3M7RDZ1_BRAPC|nr:hypothetical protein BpHYR1_020143 [Brachionus plicatilis]